MACQSAKERVKDCASLLDYGFSLCKIYTDKQPPALSTIPYIMAQKNSFPANIRKTSPMFLLRKSPKITQKKVVFQKNLSAPIKKNQVIGRLEHIITKNWESFYIGFRKQWERQNIQIICKNYY